MHEEEAIVSRPLCDQPSARRALRARTAAHHDRIDALFSRFDLARRDDYGRFLQAQAAAFLPVESALDAAGAAALFGAWPARRRGPLVLRDLEALGLEAPAALKAPGFESEAAVLGGLYVLEGSRLGGALLRRSVPAGLPTAFLTPGDPKAWRDLMQIVDARLASAEKIAAATKSARAVFGLFESAGQQFSGAMTA